MDFPAQRMPREIFGYLSTINSDLGSANLLSNTAFNAAAAWPTANKAIYCPVLVDRVITVTQMAVVNGATVNGNLDLGIYDEAGNKVVSKGSTAQSGTNAVQALDITDTELKPGLYFLALASSSGTATFFRANGASTEVTRVCGLQQQTSAFALPSTATFANPSQNYSPLIYASYRSSVV